MKRRTLFGKIGAALAVAALAPAVKAEAAPVLTPGAIVTVSEGAQVVPVRMNSAVYIDGPTGWEWAKAEYERWLATWDAVLTGRSTLPGAVAGRMEVGPLSRDERNRRIDTCIVCSPGRDSRPKSVRASDLCDRCQNLISGHGDAFHYAREGVWEPDPANEAHVERLKIIGGETGWMKDA